MPFQSIQGGEKTCLSRWYVTGFHRIHSTGEQKKEAYQTEETAWATGQNTIFPYCHMWHYMVFSVMPCSFQLSGPAWHFRLAPNIPSPSPVALCACLLLLSLIYPQNTWSSRLCWEPTFPQGLNNEGDRKGWLTGTLGHRFSSSSCFPWFFATPLPSDFQKLILPLLGRQRGACLLAESKKVQSHINLLFNSSSVWRESSL
jgi:hypothetical protein